MTTDTSGTAIATSGHYPYGENWYETGGVNKLKFTTYERDAESGNDYAIFRTYINRLGRFNRPDPIAGVIAAPQSLNRYAYVRNDPVGLTDPLGLGIRPFRPRIIYGECEFVGRSFVSEREVHTYYCIPHIRYLGVIRTVDEAIKKAKEAVVAILSGNNDCADFFNSAEQIEDTNALYGGYPIESASNLIDSVRFTGVEFPGRPYAIQQRGGRIDFPDTASANGTAGFGSNASVFLNTNGAFFNETTELRTAAGNMPLGDRAFPAIGGLFSGGSLGARITIVLHEFAHTLGLIPPDTGGDDSAANTKTILEKCKDAILQFLASVGQ